MALLSWNVSNFALTTKLIEGAAFVVLEATFMRMKEDHMLKGKLHPKMGKH